MARPIAGEPTAGSAPAPFPTGGAPAPASPFNYTNQPHLPGPTVSGTPTPAGLLNAFRRRWVLCTFIGALAAAAVAAGAWLVMPPGKHQVRAVVQLHLNTATATGRGQDDFDTYRRHQMFLIKSRDLITRVLADPAVGSLELVKKSEDPVQMVEETLQVRVAAPNVLEVSMTGNHMDDMKVVLDRLLKQYVDDATTLDRKHLDDRASSLEKQKNTLTQEIELRNKAIEDTARNAGATGGTAGGVRNSIDNLYKESEAAYIANSRQASQLAAELKVLEKRLKEEAGKEDSELEPRVRIRVEANDEVKAARKLYDKMKAEYDADYAKIPNPDNHKLIKELKVQLDKVKKELDALVSAVAADARAAVLREARAEDQKKYADLKSKLEVAKEAASTARQDRDEYRKLLGENASGNVTIEGLRAALEPQRKMLSNIETQLLELRLQASMGNRVQVQREADKVPNTNQNKKLVLSSVGGLGSFLGVVLLISFLEWRTRRVDGVDQVVTELGLRVIGTVPAFPNRASIQAAAAAGGANWRFVLNESINSTRTMLLHAAKSQSMQVVMVTSATQGEGKTSITSQLGTSMATAGMRTLIVDCDLRNPSIMKLFELPLTPGVSEVLRQEVDVSDAVQATAVPNLWVIPAGQCSNATIAALAQGNPLETLFNRLRGQFDFVIVDSCPVLPVADALLIAQHVDGVVFSIMQDVSQLPKVMTASEKLAQLNIPLVGAVVNGIKQDVYSYGYNYVKQLPA